MSSADWMRVVDQAAEMRVEMVQFIGGEPTLHPDLPVLVEHTLTRGLAVEVFSNLVHVTDRLWEVFAWPGVSLATSYYSDDPRQHAAITGRPSYARTKANIAEALRRGIPLRAGVIDLGDGQRAEAARAELVELGVSAVGYDRLRQIGRGIRDQQPSTAQLCGRCGDGVAAISPDGAVWPCVFSRWLPVGNVLEAELNNILDSPQAVAVRTELAEAFAAREVTAGKSSCDPKNECRPHCAPGCNPNCSPSCNRTASRPVRRGAARRAIRSGASRTPAGPATDRARRHAVESPSLAGMAAVPQLSAADAAHRAWLANQYTKAAATAAATLLTDPMFGWSDRSASGRVRTADGEAWLRVVIEQQTWAGGEFWTGNVEANSVVGVAKPRVLGHWAWTDGSWAVRAELMTLVEGASCSPTPELRAPIELPDTWWSELASSLAALAKTRTERKHLRQADITRRLEVFFGDHPGDPAVTTWAAAHTDLHWANLLAPRCVLVDWEGWGLAPAGYDAACLYVHSLLAPETAARVAAEFAEQLQARDGLLAQLYVTTRLLQRIDQGDYPDMAIPLHRNAEQVLNQLATPQPRAAGAAETSPASPGSRGSG